VGMARTARIAAIRTRRFRRRRLKGSIRVTC
jgi:hypothetical protein